MNLKRIKELKSKMSEDQKKKLLTSLQKLREGLVNEDEYTGTGVASGHEPKVVAKTFDTNADFDSYVNQRRGIEMTPKEQQAVGNYRDAKPTQQDRFFVRFETTDDFGNNETTVVKKLKEGGQFCWTAFTKTQNAEDEAKPEGGDDKEMNEAGEQGEMTVDDPMRITKSITFTDETQGADILANFLTALDI